MFRSFAAVLAVVPADRAEISLVKIGNHRADIAGKSAAETTAATRNAPRIVCRKKREALAFRRPDIRMTLPLNN